MRPVVYFAAEHISYYKSGPYEDNRGPRVLNFSLVFYILQA